MNVREELSKITGEEIQITDPVMFLGTVYFQELPENPISPAQPGDTGPSVLNRVRLAFNNSGAISVTNLRYGQEGQEVKILGDGFTTLIHGTYIKTNTGANKLLAANKVYTFTLFNKLWIENA